MPQDTTPEAAALQRATLSRLTGAERLRQAIELSDAVRQLDQLGRHHRAQSWSPRPLEDGDPNGTGD